MSKIPQGLRFAEFKLPIQPCTEQCLPADINHCYTLYSELCISKVTISKPSHNTALVFDK